MGLHSPRGTPGGSILKLGPLLASPYNSGALRDVGQQQVASGPKIVVYRCFAELLPDSRSL